MFKNILITLDGSDLSEDALSVAKDLLQGSEAEATLFTVGEEPHASGWRRGAVRRPLPITAGGAGTFVPGVIPAGTPSYAESKGQALERRERELLEYLDAAGRPLAEACSSLHGAVHFGDAAKEIIAFAKQSGHDLIVMATHGRSGLRETLQGSVTAEVIRSGVAPVLVVRPKDAAKRQSSS